MRGSAGSVQERASGEDKTENKSQPIVNANHLAGVKRVRGTPRVQKAAWRNAKQ
jgi:hypothetical protein